ncbi:MAG TPA: hypothetical protein PKV71_05920, partial [Calditrichia bacterium]|nr:hypothetical protein [Calditrichia bacterium]
MNMDADRCLSNEFHNSSGLIMQFLQWNREIGFYLFNEEKAEKSVFIYVDRKTIIRLGKKILPSLSEQEIWEDFLEAVQNGVEKDSRRVDILEKAFQAFRFWSKMQEGPQDLIYKYPPYLTYLVLFVLPLTEISGNYRADAYYPVVKDFLAENGLPHLPTQTERKNFNCLWADLEEWSILTTDEMLGTFEVIPFKNEAWIYAGKPLSQCLIPPYALNLLPSLFDEHGWTPGEPLTDIDFSSFLGKYLDVLKLSQNFKTIISPKSDNKLKEVILGIVRNVFDNWTGVTDQTDEETDRVRRGWTLNRLYMCLKIDFAQDNEIKKCYYRMRSLQEYPDDLSFEDKGCQYQVDGWSRPLNLGFHEKLELQDHYNKWKARLAGREVRVFQRGTSFSLSDWVERDSLHLSNEIVVLAKDLYREMLESWGSEFSKGNFKKCELYGLPENYLLYFLKEPPR